MRHITFEMIFCCSCVKLASAAAAVAFAIGSLRYRPLFPAIAALNKNRTTLQFVLKRCFVLGVFDSVPTLPDRRRSGKSRVLAFGYGVSRPGEIDAATPSRYAGPCTAA
jgi:hypothetical protein